jgi:cbb3-type cytochrome oxidase maturation protein
MEILYLLIPLSAALVLVILGLFGWALHRGQFEDLEREGERILEQDRFELDPDQHAAVQHAEESPPVGMARSGGERWH